ncbi:hypothetical protein ACOJBY_09755 [Enterococcus entomosocium]|uniref:hypothetical protein n=1 Tax=Enterococcus TaxID=1350 RepID=UPI001FD4B70E|nr:hypothetical protein LLW22_09750 [Enterococcus casseliflavus]
MSDLMEVRKEQYIGWATENLGDKTGIWDAPYLEKLGSLLKRFGLGADYYLTGIGYTSDRDRNQIANFTYLDYNTNIDISDDPPAEYVDRYRQKLCM